MMKSLASKTRQWDQVPLGRLIIETRNGLYKPDTFYGSGTPILKMFNIGRLDGTWNLDRIDQLRLTRHEHELFALRSGDILVNRVNSRELVGKCTVVDARTEGFVFESKNMRVRVNPEMVLPEWVAYWLNAVGGRDQFDAKMKQAIGQATINRGDLDSITLPLPPLPEQRQLAGRLREQLAAVADARAALQAQLAATAALPASHLRAIFSQAEAQQWARRDLGQCVSMLPAASISSSGEVKVQVITSACLSETGFSVAGIKTASMKRHDADRAMVAPGEVLIARSNTPELVGRVAAVPDDIGRVAASDLTIRLLPGPLLEARFLSNFLAWLQLEGFWKEKAGGASGTMKKITRGQLDTLQLSLPPLSRQRGLAAELDAAFAEIATLRTALEARLAAVERLPAALLREVFGG